AADIAAKVLGMATTKPLVAALPGLGEPVPPPPGVRSAGSLERGALEVLGVATPKPVGAALPGLGEPVPLPPGVRVAGSLERGALEVLEVLGRPRPELGTGLV